MRTKLLSLLLLASLALAQEAGIIAGRVHDHSGSVIVGAQLRVQNQQTGTRQKIATDSSGSYTTSDLIPGTYKITIRNSGFRTISMGDIPVLANKTTQADFTMELLPLQQEVTVTAAQSKDNPLLSGVTVSRESTAAGNLPVNGRDIHALFELMPGATVTPASITSGGQFTVGGQRPNANSFFVDGISGNVGIGIISVPGAFPGGSLPSMTTIGGMQSLASKEETERVELTSADFSAQYGGRPGAQIKIDTRAGTNDFHASLFGYIRPQSLDSADWFARGAAANLPPASVNGWGGSFGGPVWRNHTYFFASLEHSNVHDSALQLIPVASEAAREQAGPYQLILDAFPAPRGRPLSATESVGYSPLQKSAGITNFSARVDQTLGAHIQLFGRYSYVPSVSTSIELGTAYSIFSWQAVTAGMNMSFGNFIHELRFNYSKAAASAVHGPQDTPVLNEIFQALFPTTVTILGPGLELISSTPYGAAQLSVAGVGQTIAGQSGLSNERQWAGPSVTNWQRAKQDIRFGGTYTNLVPSYAVSNYSISLTSVGINSLLAGVPLGVTNSIFFGPLNSAQNWSFFAQDSFHVTDRLDILAGIRWEFTPSTFNAIYGPSSLSYPFVGYWRGIGSTPTDITPVNMNQAPTWPWRFNQFAPRIGLAYHLRRPDIVLRAGAGIFYDSQMGSIISNENPLTTWQYLPTTINPPTASATLTLPSAPVLSLPRVLEWRTSLEKSINETSILSISYFGSSGTHLLRNQATVDPNTNVLQTLAFNSTGQSNYQAFLAQYRGNITSQLYSMISYTWSHSIDTGSSDTAPLLVQPGSINATDRGASSFDVRHLFTAAFGYQVSSHPSVFLRNWNVSATLMARTGFPFDVTTVDRSIGLGFDNSGRASLVPGQPVWISSGSVPGGRELNPAAFTANYSGQNGNLGRNDLTGNGLFQIDASIRRQFRFYRGTSMETSMSAFNLLNHPAFANPVSYLGSALFGQSTSSANLMMGSGSPTTGLTPLYQAGGPRTIELSLRFTF